MDRINRDSGSGKLLMSMVREQETKRKTKN